MRRYSAGIAAILFLLFLGWASPVSAAAIALSGSTQLKTVTTGNLTFDSWTPGANTLVLLVIAQRDETKTVQSVVGNNLTWTRIADKDAGRAQCGVEAWYGIGATPTTGTTVVSFLSNGLPVSGIMRELSGIDTTTPIEASASYTTNGTDDANMLGAVTTITANAWAVAFAVARGATFTVPAGDTAAISINQPAGLSGDLIQAHLWYEGPVTTPASTQLGATGDLSGANDWALVVVSVKPADVAVFYRRRAQ